MPEKRYEAPANVIATMRDRGFEVGIQDLDHDGRLFDNREEFLRRAALPQRGGCCTVMPYFTKNILEIPVTTTQDYALVHVLNQYSIGLWKTQLELILKKNGLANFIIHPDYIIDQQSRSVYERLLEHLKELRSRGDLWFALPSRIDSWWRTRSQLRLEEDGESWRIVGEGAEHATLAYARNIDGRLVYEMAGRSVAVQ